MATVSTPPVEQRIVLHDVAWNTYERLQEDHLDSSAPRFTYDQGELEIMFLGTVHEEDNRTLALLVEMVAMELEMETINVGSMTFKRRDLQRGFEPDSSFYVQNEPRVRSRTQIDLTTDPPPDLIIEIEVTRPAIPKLPIYAAMGIPEVWRSDGSRVTILRLEAGDYREAPASAALPPLTGEVLTDLLAQSRNIGQTTWLRQVREWARAWQESS